MLEYQRHRTTVIIIFRTGIVSHQQVFVFGYVACWSEISNRFGIFGNRNPTFSGSRTDLNIPSKAYYSNGTKAVVLNSTEFQSVMFGENNFMVIPQQITAWNAVKNDPDAEINKQGAYLAVLCRISNLSEAGETLIYPAPTADDPKTGKYAYSAVAINTKTINQWEPGKKYVYNLTFCSDGGGAGKVDPNPENPGGNSNTDETPGTGGEDILGGPIKFSITVEDWETVEVLTDM